jgi:ATP sulfurylase
VNNRFIPLLLLLSLACTSNSTPQGVLEEDLMVSILAEIQLAEGKVSSLPISYDSSQVLYNLLERDIFLKHGVTDSVFITSMEYYLEDAEKMDRMYARVIDSLVVLESNPKPTK